MKKDYPNEEVRKVSQEHREPTVQPDKYDKSELTKEKPRTSGDHITG